MIWFNEDFTAHELTDGYFYDPMIEIIWIHDNYAYFIVKRVLAFISWLGQWMAVET